MVDGFKKMYVCVHSTLKINTKNYNSFYLNAFHNFFFLFFVFRCLDNVLFNAYHMDVYLIGAADSSGVLIIVFRRLYFFTY